MTPPPGIFVFDVRHPVIFPVLARPGEVIVVAPGTAHPLLVVARGTTTVLREGPPNYGALLHLIVDEIITPRTPAALRALTGT